MPSIREQLQKKPWLGWALAGVLMCLAVLLYFRNSQSKGAYSPERMQEFVTIRYSDTGDEERIRRGAFEQRLRLEVQGLLDPSKGLVNPKTQQPTGFLVDTQGWDETVARINAERKRLGTDGNSAGRARPDAIQQLPAGLPPATEQPATTTPPATTQPK